jgi:hypothetical protein
VDNRDVKEKVVPFENTSILAKKRASESSSGSSDGAQRPLTAVDAVKKILKKTPCGRRR